MKYTPPTPHYPEPRTKDVVFREGWVHSGFARAWQGLCPNVQKAYKNLSCKTVSLAGHSLGAAVAEVASVYLRGKGTHVPRVWTFGKPRTGNTIP